MPNAGRSTDEGPAVSLILAGVDGSQNSRRALEWAGRLASELGAEVLAVHAFGLLDQLSADAVRESFETEWCAPLDRIGVRNRRRLVDGPPSMTLLRVAEEEPVDLIVVGSRGAGGFPELQLGSTSLHVVQHARVPVTVIHDR
jgi:nucleotide-binding universal stress UspA family protein